MGPISSFLTSSSYSGEKCSLLPELLKTALFYIHGMSVKPTMSHGFMGPPQWKHSPGFFRVDNFCFIAHIKISARR